MFLEYFSKVESHDANDIFTQEDEMQNMEAFLGDSQIIIAAQELNNLKENLN